MTTTILTSRTHRRSRRTVARVTGTAAHVVGSLVLAGIGLFAILGADALRETEARLATMLAGLFGTESMFAWTAGDPGMGFAAGDTWLILPVSPLTAAGVLVGAVLLLGAVALWMPGVRVRSVVLASVVSVVAIAVLTQARLLALAALWGAGGTSAYYAWSTPLTVGLFAVSAAVALGALALVVVRSRRHDR